MSMSDLTSQKPAAISTHTRRSQQKLQVGQWLTILAEARQAPLNPSTLNLYSTELDCYDLRDIEAAVRMLMHVKREPGETAFPDLPTLEEVIVTLRNARLKAEREQREREQSEAEERDRREHPENYVDVRQMIHDFIQRKGEEKAIRDSKPAQHTIGIVPQDGKFYLCLTAGDGARVFWDPPCDSLHAIKEFLATVTAADLRAMADLMEKRDRERGLKIVYRKAEGA
jgi:hypothetical protein